MNYITKQLDELVEHVELTTLIHNLTSTGAYSRLLKTRHDVNLTIAEMDELSKDPNFWFYESDIEDYKNIKTIPVMDTVTDFKSINTGYQVSDYIGSIERYLPYLPYLQYAVMNNTDIHMSVYDAHNLYNKDRRNPIIQSKVKECYKIHSSYECEEKIPELKFEVPNIIHYTSFEGKIYHNDIESSAFKKPVTLMGVNIPYIFYSQIMLHPGIYCWDTTNKKFCFGNKSLEEFQLELTNIATNGIPKPIFMVLNNGVISPLDDEATLTIFIARILKLPHIPVIICISSNDNIRNHLIDGCVEYSPNKNMERLKIYALSKLLYPEIMINHTNKIITFPYGCNETNYVTVYCDDTISIQYLDMMKPMGDRSSKIDPAINKRHEELKKKETDQISQDINNIIKTFNIEAETKE